MSVRDAIIPALLLTGIPTANMAATRYTVDRVVGAQASVSGTIDTNGKAGILTAADIVDWNLTIHADGDPTTVGQLLGPLSGGNSSLTFLEGRALTATLAGLFFDFGSTKSSALLQIATPDDAVVWQLEGGAASSGELARESLQVQTFVSHQLTTQQIAIGLGPSFPLSLSLPRVRLRDEAEDALRFRADFTVDICGDGIDPLTEPVSVVFSTPLGIIYPADPSVFPIMPGEFELVPDPTGRHWRLTAAARLRTGIERFDIDDRDGSIVFVDRPGSLLAPFHGHLVVDLTIGNDTGRAEATLVEQPCGSGRWRVGR
jgi:hypothetical protein